MHILFIGNSYTFYNDLPATLSALAASRGHQWETGRFLRGGAALRTHLLDNAGVGEGRGEFGMAHDPARTGGLNRLLAETAWDVAVLQGQSLDTVETPRTFLAAGRQLARHLRSAGIPRLVLYQTWARQHLPEMQDTVTAGYARLAAATGADIAPAGEAWRRALAARPDLVLHTEDRSHPTGAGSYLAACVLYRTLAGEAAAGLPFAFPAITGGDGRPCYDLSPELAAFLAGVADAVAAPSPAA